MAMRGASGNGWSVDLRAVGLMLLAIVGSLAPLGCECFWEAKGQLIQCGTTTPIADATISCHIDKGFQGRSGDCVPTYETVTKGHFHLGGGEPCESWVTLNVQEPGFDALQLQF